MTSPLALRVYETCHLTGSFHLRSGQVSDEYFDKYLFEAQPGLLREVAEAMVALLPECDVLAGMEMGGIPIATVMSQLTGLPTVFVRKQAKEYGTGKAAEGGPVDGRRVVVIEDVVTTGGALLASCRHLRASGARIDSVVCAIDREQGGRENLAAEALRLRAALTRRDLESCLPVTAALRNLHDQRVDTARRIIVALDFDNVDDAEAIVDGLGDAGQSYKVGLELLTVAGPALAARLVGEGKDVFLDLKLFEIPTSVAGAVRAAGRLGATMVTVHAMGGSTIMEAAVRAAADFPQLHVIALTVVTSLTDTDLAAIGLRATAEEQVTRLARLAKRAGCHGVVASPQDAGLLRAELGADMLIVTPGVMLQAESNTGTTTEHARPAHPAAAISAGATHIVIGRSLTRAPDPAAVLAHLEDELGKLRAPS